MFQQQKNRKHPGFPIAHKLWGYMDIYDKVMVKYRRAEVYFVENMGRGGLWGLEIKQV